MTVVTVRVSLAAMALSGMVALAAGCGQPAATAPSSRPPPAVATGHTHSGWWCDEHGIPEHECSMCDAKVEKECKAKGDWCEKHDRAKSQCFKCDPSLKEKFAAKYRAKFDKEPPPIGEEK